MPEEELLKLGHEQVLAAARILNRLSLLTGPPGVKGRMAELKAMGYSVTPGERYAAP